MSSLYDEDEEVDLYERRQQERREREEEEEDERNARRVCPDCGGTNMNLINTEDGGGCPSCFGGFV
jgi:hypothetical protein